MEVCQYEFQFQNEYMGTIERKIGDLLGIDISQENMVRINKNQQSFILRKRDSENFMLFSANQSIKDYGILSQVKSGWNVNNAFFKGEGLQTDIGLGKGKALEIRNCWE